MDVVEHLLTCLSEEGCEIAQASDKALRFGLDDDYTGMGRTNRQDIVKEINDLLGVIELLEEHGVDLPGLGDDEAIDTKKLKVMNFMKYAFEKGTLQVPPGYDFSTQVGATYDADDLDSLFAERERISKLASEIDEKIRFVQSKTKLRCMSNPMYGTGCESDFEIRDLEYIQTHWYVSPHGCTGGDYWKQGEGQWECPSCGHLNRLYSLPEIMAMKHLFKSVKDRHDK